MTDFPFLEPEVDGRSRSQASLTPDDRGLLHAELHGMPVRDEATGEPQLVDQDGVPIEPDDTRIGSRTSSSSCTSTRWWPVRCDASAMQNLLIPAKRDGYGPGRRHGVPRPTAATWPSICIPRVIAEEQKTNPTAVATEAWGWLPPPLHDEGEKVQTDWLHDFLMDPTRDPPGRRAADAELPHVERRGQQAGRITSPPSRTPSSRTSTTSAAAAATWPSSKRPIRRCSTTR